jgi:para-nitrobenzyl esterase
MGSPIAQGLFKRAVPQSGAAHHTLPAESAGMVTDLFLDIMQASTVEELINASVDEILAAQIKVDQDMNRGVGSSRLGVAVSPFYPCVGNEVLPESPFDAISKGMASEIDVLIGSNKDENTLFMTGKVDENKLAAMAEQFNGGQALIDAYRSAYPDEDSTRIATYLSTDHVFRIPAIRLAEARAAHTSNTWMYLFAWESRHAHLRSTHSLEIPFVFDNLDKGGVDVFLGPGELPQAVANEMHQCWINFIREGDPGWPRYELEKRINMRFDNSSGQVSDPDAGKREAWEGIR